MFLIKEHSSNKISGAGFSRNRNSGAREGREGIGPLFPTGFGRPVGIAAGAGDENGIRIAESIRSENRVRDFPA